MRIQTKRGSRSKLIGTIQDFSGGMNTVDADIKLRLNEHRVLKNVDISERGELKRRAGFVEEGTLDWNTFFNNEFDKVEKLKKVLDKQGLINIEKTNEGLFYLQTNDWVIDDKNYLNVYKINTKENNIAQASEIYQNKEQIYDFLGQLRKDNLDLKSLFPANCPDGVIDLYDLKMRGMNLFLSSFGYSYDDQLEIFKNNEDVFLLNNINISGIIGVRSLIFKKQSKNEFLVFGFLSNLFSANIAFQQKVIGLLGENDVELPPNVILPTSENLSQRWRNLIDIPDVPFKVYIDISSKEIEAALPKSVINIAKTADINLLVVDGVKNYLKGSAPILSVQINGDDGVYEGKRSIRSLILKNINIYGNKIKYVVTQKFAEGLIENPNWATIEGTTLSENTYEQDISALFYNRLRIDLYKDDIKSTVYYSRWTRNKNHILDPITIPINSSTNQNVRLEFVFEIKRREQN